MKACQVSGNHLLFLAGLDRYLELDLEEVDADVENESEEWGDDVRAEATFFKGTRRHTLCNHVDIDGTVLALPDRVVEIESIINREVYKNRKADSQSGGGWTGNQGAILHKQYRATVKMDLNILHGFELTHDSR